MKREPRNTLLVAATAAAWLLASGIALAQEAPGPRGPALGQCKEDIAKLCPGIAPGGGRLIKCLHEHEAEVSAPCKAALGGKGGKAGPGPAGGAPDEWGPMAGMRKTCAAEIDKFCKDTKPGHGRIAVCLNEHPRELSPACKASVDQVVTQMNAHVETHKACAPDVQRLCGDVPPGSGRVAFCLGEHKAELSAECKQHVAEMQAGWGKRDFGARKGPPAAGAPGPAPAGTPAPPPPPPAQK
jgi:hypothetical protein